MCNNCDKLPEKIERYNKETLEDFLKRVYPKYQKEIRLNKMYFRGKEVHTKNDQSYNLRDATFEHITNSQNATKDPDYNWRRAKRFHWIPIILDLVNKNLCCDQIRVFQESPISRENDWLIWCSKIDYLIILETRNDKFIINTAFCVLYPYKKDKLNHNWIKWLEYQKRQSL